MARIRTLKPEFWDSPSTAQADLAVRLTFMAMWNWADDSGHGTANLKELEAFCWPNDDVRDLPRGGSGDSRGNSAHGWRNFAEICGEVAEVYGVTFYRVSGRPYYEITNFKKHQSKDYRKESRYPLPDEGEIYDVTSGNALGGAPADGAGAGGSAGGRGNSAGAAGESGIGIGEKGNRGTGEQSSSSAKLPASAEPPREDVEELCTRLRDHVARNTDKPPTITTKWRTDARLLLDKDGIKLEEAVRVLDWCQHDSFWKSNILSMPKFREKFAQLQIKSRQSSERGNTNDTRSAPKGYNPADWLRPSNEPAFDYIDAEVVQLREIGR